MKRISFGPRGLLVAALSVVAVVAGTVAVTSGRAAGSSSTAEYQYAAPTNTAAPSVSGTPQVGQTLTANNGNWTSDSSIAYAYQWTRCDAGGNACGNVANATAATYVVQGADVGHTLRVVVSAKNANGTTTATSGQTAAVTQSANKLIQAANVTLPNRLIVDKVQYSANPIHSRSTPTQMKVHVSDSNGNSVQGSLVYVIGVPYSRINVMPEVQTDATGWATLSITPARAFPRTGYLTLFVRARVTGQDLLGGTSTRRLVQVTIGAPTG
jgi:hypothetical protein